jgi:uncharacterized protein YoaH (UPF0181 family)
MSATRADLAAKWHDRVIIAAGEDAATGTKKLDELLDRIAAEEEPVLTPQETASLREVRSGKFKRKRGQSEKREYYGQLTQDAVERYHELRAQGRRGKDAIAAVIAEYKHMHASLTAEKLNNALHRSQHWPVKRKSVKRPK